jgi:hypothetical protein
MLKIDGVCCESILMNYFAVTIIRILTKTNVTANDTKRQATEKSFNFFIHVKFILLSKNEVEILHSIKHLQSLIHCNNAGIHEYPQYLLFQIYVG